MSKQYAVNLISLGELDSKFSEVWEKAVEKADYRSGGFQGNLPLEKLFAVRHELVDDQDKMSMVGVYNKVAYFSDMQAAEDVVKVLKSENIAGAKVTGPFVLKLVCSK